MQNKFHTAIFQGGAAFVPKASRTWFLLLCPLLLLTDPVAAAEPANGDLDEMLQSAEQWAKENLDEDVLLALQGEDGQRVRRILKELQKEFQGDYVLDLAGLKEGVEQALPVLEGFEETLPYAVWLRTRLDYFEVADELQLKVPAPKSRPSPGPLANPAPKLEREIWITKLARRPWPAHAREYVKTLKPVFAEQSVPSELVWIAEVESSFDPRARSPEGASGLFQLMPATAKRFGLSIWPSDQRLRPEPSARAAARYLKILHDKFGDWRLALAAYNCGETRVAQTLQRNKAKTFDAIAQRLPAETQLYVPKVESVLIRREGLRLAQLNGPPPKPER